MPTIFGLISFACAIYFAARKQDAFFGLLVFSAIFPATSILNLGSLWIMPYYLMAPFFVLIQFRKKASRFFKVDFPGNRLILAFAIFGAISAFIFPFLFAGIQVYSPRLGSSDETFYTFPLVFSISNVAQPFYLLLNVMVVFAAASIARNSSIRKSVIRALNLTFYFLTGTIATELLCALSGISFPYFLIENSPVSPHFDMDISNPAQRLHGTCGEPSYAGLILIAYFAAYFHRYYTGRSSALNAAIAAVAIFLIRSSSAIVALAVVGLMIVIFNPPARFPWFMHVRRTFRLLPVLLFLAISLSLPAVLSILQVWIVNKNQTGSFVNRTTMDLYSYKIMLDTYGIGVGLGSYRPSSLLTSVLGCMGIAGLFLFLLLAFRLCGQAQPSWIGWAGLAALLDMSIAIPDITHPILWTILALIVFFTTQSKVVSMPLPDLCTSDLSPAKHL